MNALATKRTRSEIEQWLDGFLQEAAFLEKYPYYAAVLAKLSPVADPSVSRMAVSLVDGRFFLHVNVDAFVAEPQFLRGVLLHEVHATAASSVAMIDGRRLHAEPKPEGLRIELAAPLSTERPTVMALRDVEAR